jgi:hypothetical protein
MQEPNAAKDAECACSSLAFCIGILTHISRFCANLKRELGDTTVEATAPAADVLTPQPMEIGGNASGDNASLYD